MRIVAEGGGTPQLRAAVRFVTMKPKSGKDRKSSREKS
ncbi:MAG: hypothetical protein ACLP5V_00750 [Candidatus Bathyarchaeia archaeon]